jgi:hypothetical protein
MKTRNLTLKIFKNIYQQDSLGQFVKISLSELEKRKKIA